MLHANRFRQRVAIVVAAAVAVTGVLTSATVGSGPARAGCADHVVIGVPGTDQGLRHTNTPRSEATPEEKYGSEVATVILAAKNEGAVFDEVPVNYAATGVKWGEAANARYAYDFSSYKWSKNSGFKPIDDYFNTVAANCPDLKLSLVGYSQGAHIAGDLAQRVLKGEHKLPARQLVQVVLLSDPAYNGTSPGSHEFRYDHDVQPGKDGFDYDKHVLVADPDHWDIQGSLGRRDPFADSDPVISVCIYGDPICDTGSASGFGILAKTWMHSLYTTVRYENTHNLAEWAGQQLGQRIKG